MIIALLKQNDSSWETDHRLILVRQILVKTYACGSDGFRGLSNETPAVLFCYWYTRTLKSLHLGNKLRLSLLCFTSLCHNVKKANRFALPDWCRRRRGHRSRKWERTSSWLLLIFSHSKRHLYPMMLEDFVSYFRCFSLDISGLSGFRLMLSNYEWNISC